MLDLSLPCRFAFFFFRPRLSKFPLHSLLFIAGNVQRQVTIFADVHTADVCWTGKQPLHQQLDGRVKPLAQGNHRTRSLWAAFRVEGQRL